MVTLSTASTIAFNLAASEAKMLGHPFIEVEHLILGLLKISDLTEQPDSPIEEISQPDWWAALKEIKIWLDIAKKSSLPDFVSMRRRFRGILKYRIREGDFSGHRSDTCRKLFSDMMQTTEAIKSGEVNLLMMARAVFSSVSPAMEQIYAEYKVDCRKIIDTINAVTDSTQIDMTRLQSAKEKQKPPKREEEQPEIQTDQVVSVSCKPKAKSSPTLDRYGRDLTQAAREGRLDPVIGRHDEMRKVIQTLLRRSKGNPMLVGDAGVGKTCIVEGIAQKIVEQGSSEKIRSFRIIELNVNNLVAGTKYRGEFEEKMEKIIKETEADPNIVLFIDEVHTIVGAGTSSEGGSGAADVFKPALARGRIRCIGATTSEEYRRHIEKDMALTRRFQVIWIEEPSRSETIEILRGVRPRLESHYLIKIPDQVIEKAVDLSIRYIRDLRLPDKAMDIVDQACAAHLYTSLRPDTDLMDETKPELTLDDIAMVVSDRCKIPVMNLTIDEKQKLLGLDTFLKSRIYGQDEAITEISESVRRARLGLRNPQRPLTVMMFLGSTGTGKTEMAKCLAEYLFDDPKCLISIDMSTYQDKHDLTRLLGAPPGYIGHDEEGVLFSGIRKHPYAVVLFDEVEKAAPEIYDTFLQIFDEGRLTDSHGRIAWFNESIIILTSNLGSRLEPAKNMAGRRIGFGLAEPGSEAIERQPADYKENIMRAVHDKFRQEIIGRIQKLIFFYPLDRDAQRHIIDRMLVDLNKQLLDQSIHVILDDEAAWLVVDQGYDRVFGARSTQQAFDRMISEPLTQALFSDSMTGQHDIRICRSGDKLVFKPV